MLSPHPPRSLALPFFPLLERQLRFTWPPLREAEPCSNCANPFADSTSRQGGTQERGNDDWTKNTETLARENLREVWGQRSRAWWTPSQVTLPPGCLYT
ncbi:hypothetical protein NL676_016187 [Syzygium grande]|nr:hypothetical protein NL676_016187 [Syzygium grande]